MLDLQSFVASMKISWLRRIFHDDSQFVHFIVTMFPDLNLIPYIGGDFIHHANNLIKNPFWGDVLKHYKNLHIKSAPRSSDGLLAENIHCNPFIIRDRKSIFVKESIDNGIIQIKDLIKSFTQQQHWK